LKIIIPERQPITNGLAIVWLVDQQSATNQHQQWFQQEVINSSLVVIFIFSFLIGFGSGLEVINFQPIAKPQRYRQAGMTILSQLFCLLLSPLLLCFRFIFSRVYLC